MVMEMAQLNAITQIEETLIEGELPSDQQPEHQTDQMQVHRTGLAYQIVHLLQHLTVLRLQTDLQTWDHQIDQAMEVVAARWVEADVQWAEAEEEEDVSLHF